KYALEIGGRLAQKLVAEKAGPIVEGMLGSYMTLGGSAAFVRDQAALRGIDFWAAGITLAAGVDLASVFPPASCLGTDPGAPQPVAGATPDLSAGTPADVAVAVNLGIVNDALYHVWHEGLLCITPATLATLKIDLGALDQLDKLLSDVPAGTKWTLEAKAGVPPTVEGSSASGARLAVHANQLALDVIATLPDHTSRSLHIDLDATVTADVVIDPADNALALAIDGAKIQRMSVVDHLGLAAEGADVGHLRDMLETQILPGALAGIGRIPVTGPVFGGVANGYVILRELRTTPAYLVAKADLFVAPAVDTRAPTTSIAS